MIYKNILIIISLILTTLLYSQDNPEYVIFTISDYQQAAEKIAKLHGEDVEEHYRLRTNIVYLDEFNWYDISDNSLANSIREEVFNQNQDGEIKYLLLLGNEVSIPPIYIATADGSLQPSDDFYSSPDDITTFAELQNSTPQVSTGRIPVNNSDDAMIVAQKLYDYMINPTLGVWRSSIGLIADDENKNGYSKTELNHTINSNNIYNQLSDNLNITQFYGINYESIENSTYVTKPQMTSEVINYINQGSSLINYIGHGSETTLGSEKIIDMDRDLEHICSIGTYCRENQKLAIWVVGTCSFGKYDENEIIMSEKLLINEFGAISLITTSRGIGAYANSIYLNNFFIQINDFILNNNNSRLGDIVKDSKRTGQNTEYLFHLLGDPALILPFPKASSDLIEENILLNNGLEIMKDINSDLEEANLNSQDYTSIKASLFSEDLDFQDVYLDTSITYSLKGDLVYKGTISENACIKIPIDIETCSNCSNINLSLFSDNESNYNGDIQIIKNIPIYTNSNFQNDNEGPLIYLYQDETIIDNGSVVSKDIPLEITIEDNQGINLMNNFQHNIRYWFNNQLYSYNLNSDLFEYDEYQCGRGSATFLLPQELKQGNNLIYIEAWDNANNRTLINYNLTIETNTESYVNNLYNFPNPFSESTFFTFYLSKYPTDIEINIYDIHGKQIHTITETCESYYNVIKWDGKTRFGKELSNGPYIYSFNSNYNGEVYKIINKIAKLK